MPRCLVRDHSNVAGYAERDLPDERPPTGANLVPWGLRMADNRVVYAELGNQEGWRGGGGPGGAALRPYDTAVSQDRRREAESQLGLYALHNPIFTGVAVQAVSVSVGEYLTTHYRLDGTRTMQVVFDKIGHYFYTDGKKGFGRISEAKKDGLGPFRVFDGILKALDGGRLDQVLAIHDAVGRNVLPVLGGRQKAAYDDWGKILRQRWFDDADLRGRVSAGTPAATKTGGIVGQGTGAKMPDVAVDRNRGVDMFARDTQRVRQPEADRYYDHADTLNLLFGAGISGTTGTLLQAAFAFHRVLKGEPLKQYVLAIIGYLVGGGMHSYHESMAVATKAGLEYWPGSYIRSLPASFLGSAEYRAWNREYYDIVQLGATHWRFNATSLPSHLNSNLRSTAYDARRDPSMVKTGR